MANFSDPKFVGSILSLAQAYGPVQFWTQNINLRSNPDATWRALLVMAALKAKQAAIPIMPLFKSRNSRVRAWACTTLAVLDYEPALSEIQALMRDPSARVRYHARQAVWAMQHIPIEDQLHYHFMQLPENIKVLVSDDNPGRQKAYRGFFIRLNFQVEIAATETKTIELASTLCPNMIITDNQKIDRLTKIGDNISGLNMTWDLCRNKALNDTLIFMFTADDVEPIFLWNGGDEFLPKPLNFGRLEQTTKSYLQL